jgi:hypothetical protein
MQEEPGRIVDNRSGGRNYLLRARKLERWPIYSFKPRIDRVFPFAKIVEAHRYMESNEQIGKIVVTV